MHRTVTQKKLFVLFFVCTILYTSFALGTQNMQEPCSTEPSTQQASPLQESPDAAEVAEVEKTDTQQPASLDEILKFFQNLQQETFLVLQEPETCTADYAPETSLAQLAGKPTQEAAPTHESQPRKSVHRGRHRAIVKPCKSETLYTSFTPIKDEIAHWVALLIIQSHELDSIYPEKRKNGQTCMNELKSKALGYFLRLGVLGLRDQTHKNNKKQQQKQKEPDQSVGPAGAGSPSAPTPAGHSGLKRSESFSSLNDLS